MKKIVIITGVTQGLGRSMTKEFIDQGFTLVGCGRNKKEIDLLSKKYPKHDFRQIDISDYEQVLTWSSAILEKFSAPDILINNASIINKNATLENVPIDEFAQVIRVNVNGTFNVIKSFLPAMKERQSGIIINISSGWGRESSAQVGPYCASKFAIEGLTGSLAKELPEGMAVVSLDPGGSIATKMLESCVPEDMEASPTPEEWAKIAVPYILQLSTKDNGKQMTFPQVCLEL